MPELGNNIQLNDYFFIVLRIAEGMLYERERPSDRNGNENMISSKKRAFNYTVASLPTLELWNAVCGFRDVRYL